MSDMWVAVTAEYNGSTFSHRATGGDYLIRRVSALHEYDLLLDEAAWRVRAGLAGWLPPQAELEDPQLSTREKLHAIENIVNQMEGSNALQIEKIRRVLQR